MLGKQKGRRTFLAEDTQTQSDVVLKLILFGPDFTWEDLKLFEREAETLKSLEHLAIPNYLDSFEIETPLGKGFVLVQTYIGAKSLQSWITAGRRFSEAELQEIARSVLLILQYLHSCYPAVIHRDIKPSNILLGDRTAHSVGTVYLVDFGSVQAAQNGGTMTIVGTYGYMPPEQFGGRSLAASDLYSLGATLICLATGRQPSDFQPSKLEDITGSELGLSAHFSQWIQQIVRADVEQRIGSAAIAFHQLTQPASPQANLTEQKSSLPDSLPTKTLSRVQLTRNNNRRYQNPIVTDLAEQDDRATATSTIQVNATQDQLTIQCPQHRIDNKSIRTSHRHKAQKSISPAQIVTRLLLGVIGISALGIIAKSIYILLPVIVLVSVATLLYRSDQRERIEENQKAEITLRKASDGAITLTLRLLNSTNSSPASGEEIVLIKTPTQFVDIPVKSIIMESSILSFYANFTFFDHPDLWNNNLRIEGSLREIKPLIACINRWDKN